MAILLHPLQVKACIKTEVVHFLDWRYIVVGEWESTQGTRLNRWLTICVTLLSAKIVYLRHTTVVGLEKSDKIFFLISV